ncbi:MAG TPA: vanadium-dependent haloperoxidase [Acidobacteriaceae bacterium]|nr:vanadium-dependent haloperoxidase [Acidobacteriaceae bacterium]
MKQILMGARIRGTAVAGIVLVCALGAAGCADSPLTAPAAPSPENVAPTSAKAPALDARNVVLQWNAIARQLVIEKNTDPPMASRFYALLSVAQYEAAMAAWPSESKGTDGSRHDAVAAAISAASAAVLSYAYPDRAGWLAATAALPANEHSARIGREAAERVLARARTDGADRLWAGTVPSGTGMWYSMATPPRPPLRPLWGEVRPWLMQSGDQFRPGPPPAFGSPQFDAAVAEVRAISDHRTPEQLRIALFWADGAGTFTPPGHWNAIAADLVARHHLDERRAALTFALLNTAVMDAGIACWDAKYHYWLIRPPEVDPAITTPVGLPNFPSYISGHATFSGAASQVLGSLFPAERDRVRSMAEEAAMSRLYGGIHYRFDNDMGLSVGRKIGAIAIERERRSIGHLHFLE